MSPADLSALLQCRDPLYRFSNDPAFGVGYNETTGTYIYGDNPAYPVRHRNWCTDYYQDVGDRSVRGPDNPLGGTGGSGLLCYDYTVAEQGLFYSRDDVQYAWQNGTATYRASEFLIGGGDAGGVWHGGTYTVYSTPAPVMDANFKNTGKPGFQLYIDGVINTDDPGWTYVKTTTNSIPALLMVSPDKKIGVMILQSGGVGSVQFNFLDMGKYLSDNPGATPQSIGASTK